MPHLSKSSHSYSQSASLTTVTMATPNHCTCVLLYSHYFALLLLNSNYLEGLFYFHHFCSSLPYTGVGHVFMSLFFQDMYLYCLLCLLVLSSHYCTFSFTFGYYGSVLSPFFKGENINNFISLELEFETLQGPIIK